MTEEKTPKKERKVTPVTSLVITKDGKFSVEYFESRKDVRLFLKDEAAKSTNKDGFTPLKDGSRALYFVGRVLRWQETKTFDLG